MYVTNSTTPETLSTIGGLAVGVPGEIRGWEMLHTRHGKLPWKRLFEPAIKVAREGFNITVDLAQALAACKSPLLVRSEMEKGSSETADESFIIANPMWAEIYAPNGTVLQEGDIAYRKVGLSSVSWSVIALIVCSDMQTPLSCESR